MRKKVLGRGLEALIPQNLKESVSETERVMDIELDEIDPNPNQPREHFDEKQLRELAASIKKHGVLQPVVVRRVGARYQLVVGERRFRASKLAGKATVPAIVRRVDDDNSLKFALLENLQREDLNPIEEARGYVALQEEFDIPAREIADILGKERSTVANTIRLLNLPAEVIALLEQGKLRAGHARAILSIEGEKEQIEWARRVVEDGFTVREVEDAARPHGKRKKPRGHRKADPQIAALEERLELLLGTRARIVPRKKGGAILIEYYSGDELEGILSRMGIDILA
ncbi:MAG: ParB/RepB/Spo0J family partition protein [Candidatus Krumholzibacteria bacterium]|jgi:ParB family chromosome partitioning protein|nr:ParB/RepB/Spo0J family partition protein [Candidatus Krumholzibacteria bacterium]